jgi:hypothetical protein
MTYWPRQVLIGFPPSPFWVSVGLRCLMAAWRKKMSQSNTRVGDLKFLAGEDLTGKEGLVVKLYSDSNVAKVGLIVSNAERLAYVLIEGAVAGKYVTVHPWNTDRNVRVTMKDTVYPGNIVVLADPSVVGDRGKVRALPNIVGTYRAVGFAEEYGVDGQTVLIRPLMLGDFTITP